MVEGCQPKKDMLGAQFDRQAEAPQPSGRFCQRRFNLRRNMSHRGPGPHHRLIRDLRGLPRREAIHLSGQPGPAPLHGRDVNTMARQGHGSAALGFRQQA